MVYTYDFNVDTGYLIGYSTKELYKETLKR